MLLLISTVAGPALCAFRIVQVPPPLMVFSVIVLAFNFPLSLPPASVPLFWNRLTPFDGFPLMLVLLKILKCESPEPPPKIRIPLAPLLLKLLVVSDTSERVAAVELLLGMPPSKPSEKLL